MKTVERDCELADLNLYDVNRLADTLSVQSLNIWRGNCLEDGSPIDPAVKVVLSRKGRAYTGWMIPFIIAVDKMLLGGRWLWWLTALMYGRIPNEPLPKINFHEISESDDAKAVNKHLEEMISRLEGKYGSWLESLEVFVDWLLWGIAEGNYPERLKDEDHAYLYQNFQVGLLQQTPADYLGAMVEHYKRKNKDNRHSFFVTPMPIIRFMSSSTAMLSDKEKGIFNSYFDPCVGSGRFLMGNGNYTIFLYGQDIDPLMVKLCKWNVHLYQPWGALPVRPTEEPPYYHIPIAITAVALKRFEVYYSAAKGLIDACLNENKGGRE